MLKHRSGYFGETTKSTTSLREATPQLWVELVPIHSLVAGISKVPMNLFSRPRDEID